jgi:hypothetical protein
VVASCQLRSVTWLLVLHQSALSFTPVVANQWLRITVLGALPTLPPTSKINVPISGHSNCIPALETPLIGGHPSPLCA